MDTHKVCNYGNRLLDLCKTTNMRILNGRTLGDLTGKPTCYSYAGNPSLIDYGIVDINYFKNILYFQVLDLLPVSIHCPISLSLYLPKDIIKHSDQTIMRACPEFTWDSKSAGKFIKSLNNNECQKLLSQFNSENFDSNITGVNTACEKFNNIIYVTALEAGLNKKVKNPSKKKKYKSKQKKWYNSNCKSVYRDLKNTARQLCKRPYDQELKKTYFIKKKRYKNILKNTKKMYHANLINQLTDLNENDPISFWKGFEQLKQFDDKNKHKSNPISASIWMSHFSKLMNNRNQMNLGKITENDNISYTPIFDRLSFKINEKEIMDSIASLKNNKSADLLGFKGEMLKAGITYIKKPITKLFNLIFTNTTLPDIWRESSLTPIHKKGDCYTPSNYRGIAIGNILYKVFCKILNTRLNTYLIENNCIPPHQIGFKQGYRTTDHILTLKTLIDKYIGTKKSKATYLYSCFVDLKSAFDTVWREGLLTKMSKIGIGGIFLRMIRNIYDKVFYRIKIDNMLTDKIDSNIGVKQGCILSPSLFNIYLSDICNIFTDKCKPVSLNNSSFNCLLYADDMVLLSESAAGLQNCLNQISDYFKQWKLTVNTDKTKIVIFNKSGHKIKRYKFSYQSTRNIIEIVESYQYLGLIFSSNGNFNRALSTLRDKGRKACYALNKKIPNCNVKIGIKLFKIIILPILTYGCEVWGPNYLNNLKENNLHHICDKLDVEKTHLKYMKYLLGVNSKSVNDGVRGELGEFPIIVSSIKHIIKYWLRVCKMPFKSMVYQAYNENKHMSVDSHKSSWLKGINNLLKYCSLGDIFTNEIHSINKQEKNNFSNLTMENVKQMYINDWQNIIKKENSKLRTYSLFKNQFEMEKYLLHVKDKNVRSCFTKLRISSHKLMIETGRYNRPRKIPVNERYCNYCKNNNIEDEIHFVLTCKLFETERELFHKKL